MTKLVASDAIRSLAGPVPDERLELLERFAQRLKASARRYGLVSRRDEERLDEHLVDSATLLAVPGIEELLEDGELADLGTGGGLPGVVVAILRPGQNVALVDSRRSRAVFLKETLHVLGLANAQLIHERIEHLPPTRFPNATARALGRIERVLRPSLEVVQEDGRLFLYKGPTWEAERDAASAMAAECGAELEAEHEVPLPGRDRTTTIVVFHVKQGRRHDDQAA